MITVNMERSKVTREVMIASDFRHQLLRCTLYERYSWFHPFPLFLTYKPRDYIAFGGRFVGIYLETINKKIIFDLHEVEDMWKYVK